MIEFFIAKKHIVERKKQSFISMLGVFIGVTVLTVSIGISNGLDKNMIQSILSLTSHILVSDSTNQEITDYEELSENINQLSGVKGSIPMIATQAIIKYHGIFGNYTSGVKVEAYDLERAEKALDLSSMIKEGKIDNSKKDGIYVGKELRSEEHTSELQSRQYLVCRLLLEKKKKKSRIEVPHNRSKRVRGGNRDPCEWRRVAYTEVYDLYHLMSSESVPATYK